MTKRTILGMLTPSSNTVLEPMVSAMVSELPDVTAHFGRFRVTEISLGDQALGQFDNEPLLEAARLLADAKTEVIAWNGTSGGWLGFDADRELCEQITRETNAKSTSSTLALAEVLKQAGNTDFGFVTPYLDGVQAKIVETFAADGLNCVAERHLNRSNNFSFSEIEEQQLADMTRAVAADGAKAISIFCTNLKGAGIVTELEKELDIPIYDTVSLAVWKSLKLAGVDPRRVTGWGRLFSDEH